MLNKVFSVTRPKFKPSLSANTQTKVTMIHFRAFSNRFMMLIHKFRTPQQHGMFPKTKFELTNSKATYETSITQDHQKTITYDSRHEVLTLMAFCFHFLFYWSHIYAPITRCGGDVIMISLRTRSCQWLYANPLICGNSVKNLFQRPM